MVISALLPMSQNLVIPIFVVALFCTSYFRITFNGIVLYCISFCIVCIVLLVRAWVFYLLLMKCCVFNICRILNKVVKLI